MIDHATVQRILDTADIVDVVSDFVTLRRRGSNWVGLCPFHNDRSPSFYVSRAKGICKCFSCGQGGSAVNFIMEHEQLSYPEALRYLANKYHIEIVEEEQTDEQRQEQTEREGMLMLNEWACRWMEQQLWETPDGQDIGMTYFKERGFNDATIRKFRLGYSPRERSALYRAATAEGFNREMLFKLGLCKDDGNGGGYDFFRGRVMFPIFNVAGKVIAFGGRTLNKEDHAKYFNSPDSLIYSKSESTMYGLFQAKRAIARLDKCFIVEGYADVITMHQAGFENVIASSGTALTDGHIHLLHRFTQNVTELFDGDQAGIRAALKGIDKLLSAGLNIKVLLLPDGEDPDSYCRAHSNTEVEQYIAEHETDFIRFKSSILLADAVSDPIKRSAALTDIVHSLAVIPSEITRSMYAQDCASLFSVDEQMLLRQISIQRQKNREEEYKERERERIRREAEQTNQTTATPEDTTRPPRTSKTAHPASAVVSAQKALIRLVVKFGMCYFCDITGDNPDDITPVTVAEYTRDQLLTEQLSFTEPVFQRIFAIALELLPEFYEQLQAKVIEIHQANEVLRQAERAEAEQKEMNSGNFSIERLEQELKQIDSKYYLLTKNQVNEFREDYLVRIFCSHYDDEIRTLANTFATDLPQLSRIHTENAHVPTELERISTLLPEAIRLWRLCNINEEIARVRATLQQVPASSPEQFELLDKQSELIRQRTQLSERVIFTKTLK